MAEELIDIYDEKMNLLGTATREQAHREGLWHTSFHCWIGPPFAGRPAAGFAANPRQNPESPFPD